MSNYYKVLNGTAINSTATSMQRFRGRGDPSGKLTYSKKNLTFSEPFSAWYWQQCTELGRKSTMTPFVSY